MSVAAHDSNLDPILEEGRQLLEQDAELRADLEEFGARLAQGNVPEDELVAHDLVVRRLGLPRSPREADSE